jgi:DNA-binding GntR family transcriptional regulator
MIFLALLTAARHFVIYIAMNRARSLTTRDMKIGRLGLTDRVHEKLKELILDQKLGPGTSLNIDKLCRELDVSSSPLREALARLSAERLVRFEPFIGYAVAEVPDRRYYLELMDVRLLLECRAARIGAENKNPCSLTAMEQAVRAMEKLPCGSHYREYRVFNSWDAKFHRALMESAGNRPLLEAYNSLHVHLHIARLYMKSGGFDAPTAVSDHRRIMEAVKNADPDAAEEAVRHHLANIQVMRSWRDIEPQSVPASE